MTAETMKAVREALKAIVDAFEPEMDDRLCGDEKRAIQHARSLLDAEGEKGCDAEAVEARFQEARSREHAKWVDGDDEPQPRPSVDAGWRPIETAPKDGTDILLFYREGIQVGGWDALWHWMADVGDGCTTISGQPTHWLPLPPPPSGDGRGMI